MIVINVTQDNTIFIFDAAEAYFGSPGKGKFYATVVYRLGSNCLKSLKTLLDEIWDGEYVLPKEEVPKAMKELMYVFIQDTRTRKQIIHQTF